MSEKQWFIAIEGTSVGPLEEKEMIEGFRAGTYGPEHHVWTEGMDGWQAARNVPAFREFVPAPPPPPKTGVADRLAFHIHGAEMQFVEIELDPGESAVAEAGSMMYMGHDIEMETIFGDGSGTGGSFVDTLVGAGKRLLTGESLFMTVFSNRGSGVQKVAFAAPYPGKIIPMDLQKLGGKLICQKDAFLSAARGVSVGIAFQKKIGTGLFGGEGFIMQKLEGDGLAFVHAGGTIVKREIAAGRAVHMHDRFDCFVRGIYGGVG